MSVLEPRIAFVLAIGLLGCSSSESKQGSANGGGDNGGTTSVGGAGAAGGTSPGGTGAGGLGGLAGTGGQTGGSGGAAAGASSGASGNGGAAAGNAPGGASGAGGGAGDGGIGGTSAGGGSAGRGGAGGAGGEVVLEPTPGNYRQACDGSLGVALDATHFLDGNDENQGMRVYTRGADANPLRTIDLSSSIGLSSSDEADLEDAARVGDRIYVVSSHGRDKDGNLERERYRFFAMDVSGTGPNVSLTGAGFTSLLLDQMLAAANWATPNTTVIATLAAASNLSDPEDTNLAPKVNGTSIEALAWAPTMARPKQLLIGFRNPTQGSNAIVVSLLNPDAVLTGATASFGEATLVDLGGLGLRAMAWSPLHGALLVLGGPKSGNGPYRLFEWSGPPSTAPVVVQDITNAPSDASPEAIVVYPNTRDIQVLFDQGDFLVGGTACKDASSSSQAFSDAIVHVP